MVGPFSTLSPLPDRPRHQTVVQAVGLTGHTSQREEGVSAPFLAER